MKTEKLQKVLARAGYGSRRQIEEWIKDGRIQVNDRIAILGDRVEHKDKIYLDGQFCQRACEAIQTRVLIYHKPLEVVTTRHDPEGRKTVFDALPPIRDGRWINIGRLDYFTSGLLLFTNDGELAHQLMHPSTQIEREYSVRVVGKITAEILNKLSHKVELEDGSAHFENIVEYKGEGINRWFKVMVREGRNRLVRRLWESQGISVNRLKRVKFGPIFLPKSLTSGSWLELSKDQVNHLKDYAKSKHLDVPGSLSGLWSSS
jgi:23S rRNA pseudouridine2605 synthase